MSNRMDRKSILPDDGEHVDQYQGQNGRQDYGTAVAGHRSDDVQQRLLAINQIEQLKQADISP